MHSGIIQYNTITQVFNVQNKKLAISQTNDRKVFFVINETIVYTHKIWPIADIAILKKRVRSNKHPTCVSVCAFSRIPVPGIIQKL